MLQWDDQPSEGFVTRFRDSLPVFVYAAWLALRVAAAILAAAMAVAVVRRLMGEDISFWRTALRALELSGAMGLAGLGAGLLATVAAHFVRRQGLIRTSAMGFAAAVGLWGTLALLAPNSFKSKSDVEAFGVVVLVFGVLISFVIWRLKEKRDEDAP